MANDCKKDNAEEYAAIVIPTMCRYSHLKRCIDSLTINKLAYKTELYIGIDYPPEEKYIGDWKRIIEYVSNGVIGFKKVHSFIHGNNLGAEGNAIFLLNKAKETHRRFVFTEDDNEFSPNYLEYCNKMLDQFEEDDSCVAVSGFNYPIKCDATLDKTYFNDIYFAAFGFAGWFNKFDRMYNELTVDWLYSTYNNRQFMRALMHRSPNQYCNFIKGMIGYTTIIERNNSVWKSDLIYGIYMFLNGKRMVFPLISKVRNWGYDGTGDNCTEMRFEESGEVNHRNFDSTCQYLDNSTSYSFLGMVDDIENRQILSYVDKYFCIPSKELIMSSVAYEISRILGVSIIRKVWNR